MRKFVSIQIQFILTSVLVVSVIPSAARAFAPAPRSPDPNRVEVGFPITRTDFAQNYEIGEAAALCHGNESVVGLAVRSGDVIDRIELLCKDVN